MSDIALTRIAQEGQMIIPQEICEVLDIEPGDYVALRPLMGGILLSKVSITPQVSAEDVLRHLVVGLGREAEQHGIREDEDLDTVIEDFQRQAYQERYGE